VNEKTIDFVMAGVASVVGGLSRHMVLDAIVQFDSNYIKRWLVSGDLFLQGCQMAYYHLSNQ
jgi:hypothetical protein